MQPPSHSPKPRTRAKSTARLTGAGALRSALVPGLFRPPGRKTWMGEWTEDGKQKRRSMGTSDEAEAATKLIALRGQARAAKAAAKQQKSVKGKKTVHVAARPETLAGAVEAHIARKRKLEGRKGGFTEASGDNMRYAMTKFAYFVEFEGAPSPPRERGKKKKTFTLR